MRAVRKHKQQYLQRRQAFNITVGERSIGIQYKRMYKSKTATKIGTKNKKL